MYCAQILRKSGLPLDLGFINKVVGIGLLGIIDVMRQGVLQMSSQELNEDGERRVVIPVSSAAAFDD